MLQLVYEYMLLVPGTCTKETRKDQEGESLALILEEGNTLILFGWVHAQRKLKMFYASAWYVHKESKKGSGRREFGFNT